MSDLDKWELGKQLTPEEEPEYLKDLCEKLRNQDCLSTPEKREDGMMVCEVISDPLAAHAADVIEELWDRLQQLEKFPKFLRVGGQE